MHHAASVAQDAPPRPNHTGGRPANPAIVAIEGHVEALIAMGDDVHSFEHMLHATRRLRSLLGRLEDEAHGRLERLVPAIAEIRAAYAATEHAYSSGALA